MSNDFSDFWFRGIYPQSVFTDSSDSEKSSSILSEKVDLISENFENVVVDDNNRYIKQFMKSNISAAKSRFLENYQNTYKEIEEWIRNAYNAVFDKERELKSELYKIGLERLAAMDQYLQWCENDMLFLTAPGTNSLEMTDLPKDLVSVCDYKLNRQTNFLNGGALKFLTSDKSLFDGILQQRKICFNSSMYLSAGSLHAPKFVIGSSGSGPGQFCRPWGVCTDATGRILVSDRSNNRIQIFNESGKYLLEFGKEGTREGEFNRPAGLAVDKKCRIIVADKDNHRIQVFTYSGGFMFAFGSFGSQTGEFNFPWDVAVNSNCDIAVSDSKNNRVQLFNEYGKFIAKFGAQTVGIKVFQAPRSVSFFPDGSLLVTDFNNHRVARINKNFNSIQTIGKEGERPEEFNRPQGVDSNESGIFVIADSKNYRIQVFNKLGKFLYSFGTKGSGLGQFDCPQGVAIHPNGNIVVVDLNNNRIQVFCPQQYWYYEKTYNIRIRGLF